MNSCPEWWETLTGVVLMQSYLGIAKLHTGAQPLDVMPAGVMELWFQPNVLRLRARDRERERERVREREREREREGARERPFSGEGEWSSMGAGTTLYPTDGALIIDQSL